MEGISKERRLASSSWIDAVEGEASGAAEMDAASVNRLHARASNPPAVLTAPDGKRLEKIRKALEARLDCLKVEWLLEKYRELPKPLRVRFLNLVSSDS